MAERLTKLTVEEMHKVDEAHLTMETHHIIMSDSEFLTWLTENLHLANRYQYELADDGLLQIDEVMSIYR